MRMSWVCCMMFPVCYTYMALLCPLNLTDITLQWLIQHSKSRRSWKCLQRAHCLSAAMFLSQRILLTLWNCTVLHTAPLTLPCSSAPVTLHKLLLPNCISHVNDTSVAKKDASLQNEFLHLSRPAVRWTLWIHGFANPRSSSGLQLVFPGQIYWKTEKNQNFNIVLSLFFLSSLSDYAHESV